MSVSSVDVGVVMGSISDWPCMKGSVAILRDLEISFETKIISAHRTPERLRDYGQSLAKRGIKLVIAGAGGSAHLPGMLAAYSHIVPILGVPMVSGFSDGLDSLLSIVNMPKGVPVATMSLGACGAVNAGLFAASIIAIGDKALAKRLESWRQRQTDAVPASPIDENGNAV